MIVLKYCNRQKGETEQEVEDKAKKITLEFMRKIPEIRAILETDIDAAYEGDPAADSKDEITKLFFHILDYMQFLFTELRMS